MAAGAFRAGEARSMVLFAPGSAAATAAYSIIDGTGARVAGDAVAYVAWLFVADAILFGSVTLLLRGTAPFRPPARVWMPGGPAAAASYGAHGVSVRAMTQAPIALVTALRETSILFAVLIGWPVFRERLDLGKAVATGLILAGAALIRLCAAVAQAARAGTICCTIPASSR
jgi:drug/metabolite transporter (DMT)-like permease